MMSFFSQIEGTCIKGPRSRRSLDTLNELSNKNKLRF